jgi:hypothetical protein
VFNRFEQVDESVVTGADVLDRLMQLCVNSALQVGNKQGSYRKKDGDGSKNGIFRNELL